MEKKKIKINYVGFWRGFDKENNFFSDILKERYEVEVSEKPDFVFATVFGKPFDYTKYDCVRILYAGEPFSPDFNAFDYAIAFDRINFEDRYYRYPYALMDFEKARKVKGLTRQQAEEALAQKEYFANFIYSHHSAHGEREKMLEAMSAYKRVECIGSFMNNMEDGRTVNRFVDKIDFLKKCKFTITGESIGISGFNTEKIVNAFEGDTVPLYFGDPHICEEYNSKAFVNVNDFESIEKAVEKIIELDNDDEAYISMLMEPKYIRDTYVDDMYNGLKEFLFNIFDQEPKQAYRRCRYYVAKTHCDRLAEYARIRQSRWYKFMYGWLLPKVAKLLGR